MDGVQPRVTYDTQEEVPIVHWSQRVKEKFETTPFTGKGSSLRWPRGPVEKATRPWSAVERTRVGRVSQ